MKQNTFIKGLPKRWIMLGCIVLAIAAGFVYILNTPPIYTCSSRVFVEQSGPRIMDETEDALIQSRNFLHTHAELMKSTPIISNALERPGISDMKSLSDIDNKIAYVQEKVKVSVGAKDDVMSVSLDSSYPEESAHLVNALVDAYVSFLSRRQRSSSVEVLKILQAEKAERQEELSSKHKAMANFKKEHEALALESGKSNIILDRLTRLSQAMTDAELKAMEAEADCETVKKFVSDPDMLRTYIQSKHAKAGSIFTGHDHLRLHKELDLDLLRRELADLRTQVDADHPSIEEKKAKTKQIEMQLADLDKKFAEVQLALAMQQHQVAQQRKKEITRAFEEQRQMALKLNEQLAQYAVLEANYQQSEKACALLDNRIKELNVTEDAGVLNVSILEVAMPADKPSGPQKGRVLALALILGMMSGGGLCLLKGLMDHS